MVRYALQGVGSFDLPTSWIDEKFCDSGYK
jgi:hypothetical protein